MQSNEPSKKTRKPVAKPTADLQENSSKLTAPEVKAKPRTSKSSTSKKTETGESTPVKHHHRAIPVLPESSAVVVAETGVSAPPKALAVAAGATSVATIIDPAGIVAEPLVSPSLVTNLVSESKASHNEIAELAYSYWVARGHHHGSPEEDWLRAEQELEIKR